MTANVNIYEIKEPLKTLSYDEEMDIMFQVKI